MSNSTFAPTLILFTRVPKAGQAKTRLIPALGEQGAAEFQWYLLERLLGEAVRLEETIKGSGDEYLALTRFLKFACVGGE